MGELSPKYRPNSRPVKGVSFVVQGINPIAGQLSNVVRVCREQNDVFVYELPVKGFYNSDLSTLPNYFNAVQEDVQDKIGNGPYTGSIEIHGVSAGAAIAMYVAKRTSEINSPSVCGACGVEGARNFLYNPMFYSIARDLRRRGVTLAKLRYAWRDIDATPNNIPRLDIPLLWTAGTLDPVSPYDLAKGTMRHWNQVGIPGRLLRSHKLGHTAVINEYNQHFRELREQAQSYLK